MEIVMRQSLQNSLLILLLCGAGICFLACGQRADAVPLDRGHRVLVARGLQIQAKTFQNSNQYWSCGDWQDSLFTTVFGVDGGLGWYSADGPVPWGRVNLQYTVSDVTTAELPYLSDMVSWQLQDEQILYNSNWVAEAKTWMDAVHAKPAYNDVILHTVEPGLYPGTTESALSNYMGQAHPDMLMFDAYPFSNGSPDSLYKPMSLYRKMGLKGNDGTSLHPIPYGLYLQTFLYKGSAYVCNGMPCNNYRPSESEIRFNQFAAWAFGFKFACAFIFDDAVDAENGTLLFSGAGSLRTRMPEFAYVAETNRQSRNLGTALVRLLSTDVRLKKGTNSPSSTTDVLAWAANLNNTYITAMDVTNLGTTNSGQPGDILVGYFKLLDEEFDGHNYSNQSYFMIVNAMNWPGSTAAATRQLIHVTFTFPDTSITELQRISRETGLVEKHIPLTHLSGTQYYVDIELDGGTGDLFKFNTGAPFVGTYPTSCGELGYLVGDLSKNCYVDFNDFGRLAGSYADCTDPCAPCNYLPGQASSFNCTATLSATASDWNTGTPVATTGKINAGNSDAHYYKGLLKFAAIPEIAGKTIGLAKLHMKLNWTAGSVGNGTSLQLNVRASSVQSAWTTATTWATLPAVQSSGPYTGVTSPGNWYEFDVTAAVQGWANGTVTNNDLLVDAQVSNGIVKQFYEAGIAEAPYLTIEIGQGATAAATLSGTCSSPSGLVNTSYWGLITGYSGGTHNTLLKFNVPWVSGSKITNATLHMYHSYTDSPTVGMNIGVSSLVSSWTTGTTFATIPAVQTGGHYTSVMATGWYSFDVTAAVQEWANGIVSNNDLLVFAQYAEGITKYCANYSSATPPYLTITVAAPVCGDGLHPYPVGDINKDCYVDIKDVAEFAATWLACNATGSPCNFVP